jgi:hypothetical protein
MVSIEAAFPAEQAIGFLQSVGTKYLASAKIEEPGFSNLIFRIGLSEKVSIEFLWDSLVVLTSEFYRGEKALRTGVMRVSEAEQLFREIVQWHEEDQSGK